MRSLTQRAIALTATATLALALTSFAAAAPAQAHDSLVSSTPGVDSTITELPSAFSVTMNEPLADLIGDGSGFAIEVKDAAGLYYGDGCFAITDATLSTGATLGPAGAYTMLWQVVSADGHTASGELGFTWAPTATQGTTLGSATPPECGSGTSAAPTESATSTPDAGSAVPSAVAIASTASTDAGPWPWITGGIAILVAAALVTIMLLVRRRTRA